MDILRPLIYLLLVEAIDMYEFMIPENRIPASECTLFCISFYNWFAFFRNNLDNFGCVKMYRPAGCNSSQITGIFYSLPHPYLFELFFYVPTRFLSFFFFFCLHLISTCIRRVAVDYSQSGNELLVSYSMDYIYMIDTAEDTLTIPTRKSSQCDDTPNNDCSGEKIKSLCQQAEAQYR